MLRRILIFLLALIVGFGSTIALYQDEVKTMVNMVQNQLGTGGNPDGPSNPGDNDLDVASVEVDASEAKTVYAYAEDFTTEGLKITVTFVDGSTKQVSPEECKIGKVDTSKPGTRQVTVTYAGVTTRYEITINAKVYPTISSTSLVDITGENDSVPYRVEAELIDMVTPGVVKAEGVDSFVATAPEGADITSGEQYLTGYGVKWNYFGFTFTAAEKYENVTLVLRVANPTDKIINAGVVKMYLNLTQDENGTVTGNLPLDGYIIAADGACKWADIVIRNVTIPAGTNALTFEVQGADSAFDIDYVDFYVGMRYISSVVEIKEITTVIKDLEALDTEKAFTRVDVANAHGLKDGQLFVENVTKPIEGQVTNGGTSVGAIGKGSQMSTTLRLAQDATILIKFKASAVGKGAYYIADNWNFYIDGVKLTTVESVNIEGGNKDAGQWWDWKYTNVGVINLSAGDHFFLLEVHGSDCNVDTVEFEVISLGSFDDSGVDLEDIDKPKPDPIVSTTIDKEGTYIFEAEDLSQTNLKPSDGWEDRGVQIETPSTPNPATSGGKSIGACGGGYTTITFTLKEKATIQIYGRLAHANGGAASNYMSMKLGDTTLTAIGDLPKGDAAISQYWNWADIAFGAPVTLEAGEYTLTINFIKNPNFDCVKIDVITYGNPEAFATIEAETFGKDGVVTRQDMIDAGRIPAGDYMSETGNGATCICGFTSGTWFKFNFTVEKAMTLEMFLIGATDAGGYDVSTKLAVTVNGKVIAIPGGLLTGSGATPYWDWQTVSLGKVALNAGDNEIVLTILDGHPNLDKVLFYETEACTHANKADAVQENVVDAKCNAEGSYDAVVYCADCGVEISREAKTVDKIPHTEVDDDAVGADCINTGLTAGKHCSVCNTVIVPQDVVPAKGHDYNTVWTNDTNGHWHVCKNNCGIKADEAAHTPNIDAPGEDDAQVCTVCAYVIAPATGHIVHTYTELKYDENGHWYKCTGCELTDGNAAHTYTNYIPNNDATCTADGTETAKCDGCENTHTQTDADSMLDHTFTTYESNNDATCTADGTETAKCDNCDATHDRTIADSKLPHTEAEAVKENEVPASCLVDGSYDSVVKCSVCSKELSRENKTVTAPGHTEQVLPAVAATSATTGLTEGKKCSACGVTLVAQVETPIIKLTINAAGEYVFEAENLDMSTLTPSAGQAAPKVEYPNQEIPVTSGGASLGAAGGGYTTFTFTLEDKATVQLYARIAHANGIAPASNALVVLLDKGILELQGDVSGRNENSTYFNWNDIACGGALNLDAGTYTVTIRFKSNPNVDCFKINVLSYGSFKAVTEGDLTINGAGKYTYEAENVEKGTLVLRQDFINANKFVFTEGWSNDLGNGSCLMGFTDGSVIRFYVDVKEAATLAITMRMSYYSAASFDFSGITYTFAGQTLTPVPAGDFGHRAATDYWMWVDVAFGEVEVEAGVHLFEIKVNKADNHNIDRFVFTTITEEPLPCDVICDACGKCTSDVCTQADHATKCAGHDVVIKANDCYTIEAENWSQEHMTIRSDLVNHAAKNGNRLLENGGTTIGGMAAGSYITFNVYVKENSTVAFVMKAADSVDFIVNQAMSITIDGVEVELCNANLKGSGSAPWFDWTILTVGYANIPAGEHTVVLKFIQKSPNVDYLKLDVMSYGSYTDSDITLATNGTTKYELENIDCTQCLINTRNDFIPAVGAGNCGKGSGRIYGYTDGSIFRFVVTVEEACTLEIKLAGYGGKNLNQLQFFFGETEIVAPEGSKLGSGAVAEGLVGTVSVEAGTYVFEFTSGAGTDLDYVSFTVVE